MGAILRVKVHYTTLHQSLANIKSKGISIYGTFLEGENIYNHTLSPEGVIVMGNEGRGITDECARHITDRLYIPPYPANCQGSESLNVAIATSIVCSEFRRR